MMPYVIWTFPNPQLTLAMHIFLFLKPSNLVPTTRCSQLAPPSPCNAQCSSLPVSLLLFQVSAKMSPLPKALFIITRDKMDPFIKLLSIILCCVVLSTYHLVCEDKNSMSVNPPFNSQCLV